MTVTLLPKITEMVASQLRFFTVALRGIHHPADFTSERRRQQTRAGSACPRGPSEARGVGKHANGGEWSTTV